MVTPTVTLLPTIVQKSTMHYTNLRRCEGGLSRVIVLPTQPDASVVLLTHADVGITALDTGA